MKHLRQYIRQALLTEAMKTPSDLPDSAYVVIDDSGNNSYFEVVIEDPDTPIYDAFGADTLAGLQVSKAPSGYCDGAWQIIGATAKDGYGPLAYDIAMEYVGNEGLMCDRSSVSEDAAKVWDFYLNSRPDVKAVQLDSVKKPFLTPKDASDDCTGEYTLARHTDRDIAVRFDPYGNEEHRKKWMDHWSTKKYVKTTGTPIIDELNDLNLLYYDYEEIGQRITESDLRKTIRKTLREFTLLAEGMVTAAELPLDIGVEIYTDKRSYAYIGYCVVDNNGNHVQSLSPGLETVENTLFSRRQEPLPEEFQHPSGIYGTIAIEKLSDYDEPNCDGAFLVVNSVAKPGYGPLLYDVAIEYASILGSGLVSDRYNVSPAANKVYAKYTLRDDVEKFQCDDELNTLTPDNSDNLVQDSAMQGLPAGAKFTDSPLSMRYSKDPTRMESLKSLGKLVFIK